MKTLQPIRALMAAEVLWLGLAASLLQAQVPSGWRPVDSDQNRVGAVGVKLVPTDDGYQVFFKHFGAGTVHFGFYLEGVQTPDDVPRNGRIHLKPGNLTGALAVQVRRPLPATFRVRAVQVAVGDRDLALPDASEASNL